jgi:hypothetical protein
MVVQVTRTFVIFAFATVPPPLVTTQFCAMGDEKTVTLYGLPVVIAWQR